MLFFGYQMTKSQETKSDHFRQFLKKNYSAKEYKEFKRQLDSFYLPEPLVKKEKKGRPRLSK